MTKDDRIIDALERLASATQTRTDDAAWLGTLRVYVENLERYSADIVTAACRKLETTATWMPKVAEILDQCRQIHRTQAPQAPVRLDPQPDPTPEQLAMRDNFLAELRAMIATKRMPNGQ